MTAFNIDNIKRLVERAYLATAREAFGAEGDQAIADLLDKVRLFFQRCPPESVPGPLVILKDMKASATQPRIAMHGIPGKLDSVQELGIAVAAYPQGQGALIEVADDGTFFLMPLPIGTDFGVLANDGMLYRYEAGVDVIRVKQSEVSVPKISPLLKSNFAVPTFHGLEEALSYYRQFALESVCRILAQVWENGVDGPRLVLVNRPEAHMRDSLIQSLQMVLRDTSVWPEHNTDETKPVDIKVEWFGSGASALIEVKWMGRSTAKSKGKNCGGQTYTDYGASRAQAGANQLADYLDREIRHSESTKAKGYLVVFDARRRNVSGPVDKLTAEDAMHFANVEVSYDPDHSKVRNDFSSPVRYFLNPRKSQFAIV